MSKGVLDLTVREFVGAAAAKTPTPGGGSVAAVVGSLGVALGQMSLNFTIGKKKYAQHAAFHEHLAARMEKAQKMCLELVDDDVAAYSLYQDAMKLEDGPQKQQALQLALAGAINVPREMTKLALAVIEDLGSLADKCNTYLISDLLAGATLCVAAIRLCDYNVRINVPQLEDKVAAQEIFQASASDRTKAYQMLEKLEQACKAMLP